jgi:hypothetical protein
MKQEPAVEELSVTPLINSTHILFLWNSRVLIISRRQLGFSGESRKINGQRVTSRWLK